MYGYGVFFKPLIADFGWSRAATAGVYSTLMIAQGISSVATGWLADRFGPARVMASCSFATGLGLALSSQITALWHIYVTYGLITGIGLGAAFPVATATTAHWFTKHRGLALGIVSSGLGLGAFVVLPIAERLIAAYGWSASYLIFGAAAWTIMVPSSLLLRRPPRPETRCPHERRTVTLPGSISADEIAEQKTAHSAIRLNSAARRKPLLMLVLIYFLLNICLSMVMVHLVNYTTDLGIAPLVAAAFVSIIGIASVLGRLTMGVLSDRIGSSNALAICCTIVMAAFVLLVFGNELWLFYVFSVTFGFAYGGEIPQMPALVGRFFGLKAVASLVGVIAFGATLGSALGSWAAGQIFYATESYRIAFALGAMASLFAVIATIFLKKTG